MSQRSSEHDQSTAAHRVTVVSSSSCIPGLVCLGEEGKLDEGARDQRECGKYFPEILGGLLDSQAKDDVANSPPPPDGKIASANQLTGTFLDAPGDHWKKHEVCSGETLDISWYKSAKHATRCWKYFITKVDWDPEKVLSRAQFETEPFFTVRNHLQPYWGHEKALEPTSPTTHGVPLPELRVTT